jgi:hypothetical protein
MVLHDEVASFGGLPEVYRADLGKESMGRSYRDRLSMLPLAL